MNRMDQLPRNHTDTHLPFLGSIPPIVGIVPIFLLIPNFILSHLVGRGVHFLALQMGVEGGVWDWTDRDGGVEGDSSLGRRGGRTGGGGRVAAGSGSRGMLRRGESIVRFFLEGNEPGRGFVFHVGGGGGAGGDLGDAGKAEEPGAASPLFDGGYLFGRGGSAAVPSLLVLAIVAAAGGRGGGVAVVKVIIVVVVVVVEGIGAFQVFVFDNVLKREELMVGGGEARVQIAQ